MREDAPQLIRKLESNGLTGPIPFKHANLKNLQELLLDRSKLQGTAPGGNGTKKSSSHEIFRSAERCSEVQQASARRSLRKFQQHHGIFTRQHMINKGTIKGGPEIAVKSFCIKEEQWFGYHELYFQREVADLARLNHENTGKLLGVGNALRLQGCWFSRLMEGGSPLLIRPERFEE